MNFIIPYELYPFDVMVSIGESDEQLSKTLRKHLPLSDHNRIDLANIADTAQGRCVMFNCGATLIRLKQRPKTHTLKSHLQHEIFHAVEFLMDRIGVKHSLECGEVYAYAIGYLTNQVYKQIENGKKVR